MTRVVVTPAAVEDLDNLIASHSLPPDTRRRFARSLRGLERHPLLGAELGGRWEGFRFLLGPWRWMIVVYIYDEADDRVAIVSVHDGRAARSPTSTR